MIAGLRRRHRCPHQRLGTVDGVRESFIKSSLIDMGRRKMFWCSEKLGGCGKVWFS